MRQEVNIDQFRIEQAPLAGTDKSFEENVRILKTRGLSSESITDQLHRTENRYMPKRFGETQDMKYKSNSWYALNKRIGKILGEDE